MSDPAVPNAAVTPLPLNELDLNDQQMDDLLQQGNLSSLTMRQRSIFVFNLAKRLGLNPLTKPFDFIVLNNKLTLYANRTCSDQLRQKHQLNTEVLYEGPLMLGTEIRPDVYCVKVKIWNPDGRSEHHTGSVGINKKSDEELANAIMKCHTKALRRATISFCGLGFLDETEVESVRGLEGGVGSPRQLQPGVEQFDEPAPANLPQAVPVMAKPLPAARPLPQAGGSTQPAAPKLPTVLPAVKPGA